tara:strand:+ start:1643 stop:2713 length:1071 start_codon:yes stop_codon:yes gene_type:complete
MKWRSLLAVVLGLSVSHVATFAQRPLDAERLSTSRASPERDAFFSSSGVVRFQLIQGRLGLNPMLHRNGAQQRQDDEVFESITVTAQRGIPSLHYVLQQPMVRPLPSYSQTPQSSFSNSDLSKSHLSESPLQHITLSVDNATEVKIESELKHTGERSVLNQPAFGMIRWEIQRGDQLDSYTGSTLFHVRLQNPEVFDLHYADLTSRVLRGNSIAELSDQIHVAVLAHHDGLPAIPLSEVVCCVEQLRSPRQSVRISAQQQLLRWGTPIIPMVQRMMATDLELEQRARLGETMRMLRPRVEDTPRSLAMLMVNDPLFWELEKPHLTQSEWGLVNQHLQQMGVIESRPHDSSLTSVTR